MPYTQVHTQIEALLNRKTNNYINANRLPCTNHSPYVILASHRSIEVLSSPLVGLAGRFSLPPTPPVLLSFSSSNSSACLSFLMTSTSPYRSQASPALVMTEMPLTPPLGSPTKTGPFASPFSDYFTDTSASASPEPAQPSPVQKSLLHRLGAIGEQIQRREPGAIVAASLHASLDALEALIAAPESQSREPADVGDSGLFLEDDGGEPAWKSSEPRVDACHCRQSSTTASNHNRHHRQHHQPRRTDKLLKEAQAVLARVTESSKQLRKRYEEVKVRFMCPFKLRLDARNIGGHG